MGVAQDTYSMQNLQDASHLRGISACPNMTIGLPSKSKGEKDTNRIRLLDTLAY